MDTPSISDLHAELETFEQELENRNIPYQVLVKISKQIPVAQQRAQESRQNRDSQKKADTDSLLSIDMADLSGNRESKSKLDAAELDLIYRRDELKILLDGQKLFQEKIDEIVKRIDKSYLSIREMARQILKAQWSRDRFWKMGSTAEVDWRSGVLEVLLAKLASGDRETIQALKLFFADKKFLVSVVRGFQDVKEFPIASTWSDDLQRMVDGTINRKIRVFQKHEEIVVPGDLSTRMAFEQFITGRLAMVSA